MPKLGQLLQNKTELRKVFSYLLVGGVATIVEWVFFWLFNSVAGIQYLISTIFAMVISTFSNWYFGRLWTFKDSEKKGVLSEIAQVYLAGIVGVLLNMLIMYILVEKFAVGNMLSKMLATAIVFAYNYLIRRLLIYRNK